MARSQQIQRVGLRCRFVYAVVRALMFGIQRKVIGLNHLPQGAAILTPNHSSFLDPPLVAASLPAPAHFLARSSLFHPLWGWLLRGARAHPVSRNQADPAAYRMMQSILRAGEKLVLFPEGRRSANGELLHLKLGAALLAIQEQVPLVPVWISGAHELWPPHQKWPKFFGKVTLTIGQPIYPPKSSPEGDKEAAHKLTQRLSEELLALSSSQSH